MGSRSLALLTLALLMGGAAAAYAVDETGTADLGLKLSDARIQGLLRSAAAQPGVSGATIVDTTWVGFSTAPGVANYWSVGPGPNRPTPLTTGVWQWDQVAQMHGDSLAGWWPIRMAHTNASGPTRVDEQRPWWAIEQGNQANYVINQGDGTDPAHPGVSYKRTFGVVGVWHRDPGNSVIVPDPYGGRYSWPANGGVNWAPLEGSFSAWMGLRQHGDLTVSDNVTGNPFNVDCLQFNGTGGGGTGSNKTFPGYAQQMDQMLYRDVDVTGLSGPVTLSFQWQSNMSTGKGTTPSTRTGWFEGDPLSINAITPGNFVSAEAGSPANATAPVDSFQVYVGKPVEGSFVASDGVTRPIYDPLRRWFNEVLDKNQRRWLFGAAGINGATTTPVTISAAELAALKAGGNNTLRIVFRVHTNAGTSDESTPATFCSNGQGAAQVDNVIFNGTTIGTFEGAGDIDNTKTAAQAWRSTGKPPAIYFHVHNLATLPWNDICGGLNSPIRICDMRGNVISSGDHDNGEAAGGPLGTTEEEGNWGMVSPTIGMVASSGVPNTFGLTLEAATPTQSYSLVYEGYFGIYDLFNQGNAWQFGAMCYPALQLTGGPAAGTPQWGERRLPPFLYFNPLVQCYASIEDLSANGQILSANGSGTAKPDSMRIFQQKLQQCYRFGITTGCSPTGGSYWDNISLAILDGTPAAISVDIWDFFNDTFPFTETPGLPGTAAFDTTSALVRTGLNTAQTTTNLFRFDVPADSVFITAPSAPGEANRVDMVFRIKPGVGNYVTIGNPSSGLRALPTSAAPAGPSSFWGQYLGAPVAPNSGFVGVTAGEFAIPGAGGALDTGWPGGWNWNVWRSARCDTAEVGLFPVSARGAGDVGLAAGQLDANNWMSCYHESDPHYAALGISKPKCFLVDTLGAVNSTNITCSSVPAWVTTFAGHVGYDGNATTIERTQILPDGLLTPGAHVEYFFRKSRIATPATFDMVPDTNLVYPQPNEGPNFDAHRWQQFGVLPDRWKDAAFGGLGMACMLYVDLDDRLGDERAWVSTGDSTMCGSYAKHGAHDGWGLARSGTDINDRTCFVAAHGGQAGTSWDMYGVKASESLTTSAGALGGRLSYRDPSPLNLVNGKYARMAPTPEMAATYYKLIMILTGSLDSGLLGPFNDRSQDDIGFLTGFAQGATVGSPRGLFISGDGFYESLSPDPFLTDILGGDLLFQSYLQLSGNPVPVSDLAVSTDISPAGDIYGVRNGCRFTNDVLTLNPALTEAKASSFYSPVGATQYIAGIIKPANVTRPWIALSNGFDILNLTGRFDVASRGRLAYVYNVMSHVFGSFCTVQGIPCTTLDVDDGAVRYLNAVRLLGNPVHDQRGTVMLILARPDRVQLRVYDVAGRLVRTLADRVFKAGEHRITWDGVDDHGGVVAHGVYFVRTRYVGQGFESDQKLVILR